MENENTQIVKPSIGLSILMYLFFDGTGMVSL